MKLLFTTTLFFFGIFSVFAQHNISSKIIDKQNEPLPFANIVLYNADKTTNPKGTVSRDDGTYILEKISEGEYTLEIYMLGIETEKIAKFNLTANKTFNITLKETSQSLNEVVVKCKRLNY